MEKKNHDKTPKGTTTKEKQSKTKSNQKNIY
jgi:hypothetical protein